MTTVARAEDIASPCVEIALLPSRNITTLITGQGKALKYPAGLPQNIADSGADSYGRQGLVQQARSYGLEALRSLWRSTTAIPWTLRGDGQSAPANHQGRRVSWLLAGDLPV